MLAEMNMKNVMLNIYLSVSVKIIPKTEMRAKTKNDVENVESLVSLRKKYNKKGIVNKIEDPVIIFLFIISSPFLLNLFEKRATKIICFNYSIIYNKYNSNIRWMVYIAHTL